MQCKIGNHQCLDIIVGNTWDGRWLLTSINHLRKYKPNHWISSVKYNRHRQETMTFVFLNFHSTISFRLWQYFTALTCFLYDLTTIPLLAPAIHPFTLLLSLHTPKNQINSQSGFQMDPLKWWSRWSPTGSGGRLLQWKMGWPTEGRQHHPLQAI